MRYKGPRIAKTMLKRDSCRTWSPWLQTAGIKIIGIRRRIDQCMKLKNKTLRLYFIYFQQKCESRSVDGLGGRIGIFSLKGGAEAVGCQVGPRQWDVSLAPCITRIKTYHKLHPRPKGKNWKYKTPRRKREENFRFLDQVTTSFISKSW